MAEIQSTEDAAPFPCVRCGSGHLCLQVEVIVDQYARATTTLCSTCQADLRRLLDGIKTQLINFLAERPPSNPS